ncbi:MAG TPA: LamG domain-containing protein [Alphaproteobacteria bacterium]|nr:LamG domain-containing protein [Alphaproteobacteria bacterium]
MNFSTPMKILMNAVLIVLGIGIVTRYNVTAQTRLGLHVTQEELDIWRQRAISGPYKSAGDVAWNTPGDWDRIVANKNSFMSNPSADIWDGYTGSGCVPRYETSIEPRSQAIKMRDAAFFSLIKEDTGVRNQVLSTLKAQISRPGVDFSNRSKWCLDRSTRLYDLNPGFVVAEWATRLLYAYDYIQPYISASDRQAINAWFGYAGYYFRINSDESIITDIYGTEANFLNGILSSNGASLANNCDTTYYGAMGLTHIGGNKICTLGQYFNNRRAHMTAFYAQVGIMLNDGKMKSWSKHMVQEYIKYHVYPDSTLNELYRSHKNNAALGWAYAFQTYGKMMDIADVFARAGDSSLYEFVTSEGGGPTKGGSKSIKTPAEFYVKTTEGTWLIYNWNTSISVENLISGVWYPSNYYGYDVWLAQPNIYWKDSAVTQAYLDPGAKNKQGTTAVRDTDFSWMGSGKAYPGKLFMFGQMEGKVWPYGANESVPPPSKDTSLPPSQGAIARWKLDETQGTTASDSSGNNNTGTLFSGSTICSNPPTAGCPTWTDGALHLDGSNDYVSVPHSLTLSVAGDLTIVGWIYPTNIAKGRQGILFKHHNNEYEVIMEATGKISFYHGDGGWEDIAEPAGMVATQNQWNHITITRTMRDKTIRFYLNGSFVGAAPFTKTPMTSANRVIIGSRAGAQFYFQGFINDIGIYNRVLSSAEIESVYDGNNTTPLSAPANLRVISSAQ